MCPLEIDAAGIESHSRLFLLPSGPPPSVLSSEASSVIAESISPAGHEKMQKIGLVLDFFGAAVHREEKRFSTLDRYRRVGPERGP
ncbi:hypothetical protein KUCAC02_009415 [Chaenocephalus aceratus]|uniref:Uncharacterized protein n=1 Tax=Chaenocephalus aceratus TaxID=36190 RepID=A0ACB9WUD3_CHAAC|nr:hypothetical protein KUCAC02_009415 [Chaenocephalus aceratus]